MNTAQTSLRCALTRLAAANVFFDRQTGRHTCGEASRIDPPNLESAWLAQQNAERIAERALSSARNS